MANSNLTNARNAKNDEFYTQYHDIQKEIEAYLEFNPNAFRGKTVLMPCDDPEWSNFTKFFAQNFERYGLKKLISTSYAPDSKTYKTNYQPTLFEVNDPQFDEYKTVKNGKIFTLTRDKSGDGKIDVNDLEWEYLKGDGDFNSKEIKKLRDEADIIITNPPFSLFRDFLAWVIEADKQFLIIGNMNAIAYKELFPHIKENKVWLGATNFNKGMYFKVPSDFVYADTYKFEKEQNGEKVNRVPGVCWFTNIDHGRRHQPMPLMTMEDNLKFSKHKEIKGKESYDTYENYDAIEVPFADAIPSDYKGIMGVPISYLDKYCPEQFEIIGSNLTHGIPMSEVVKKGTFVQGGPSFYTANGDGTFKRIYTRILIKNNIIKK
ncbi:adenine-specific methyltransferase EcoRI family protein [Algoriphagus antarcticus]|uniref:Adenine-specific methyltransferase EcoRI-like protein n=1 Tax=Algoriphagus antarcticus TaxID=238540 RepID=A0A3E0D2I9_9BACT|nr:adenine-specific methyltransferase EcoRI family protein [Algoriphagus antarcticus]REG76909.1 adenine-specific methyltransferase EcoRI-like protein [Algoriphagus antarcticus]